MLGGRAEHRIGNQDGGRLDQIQLSNQIQGMPLPVSSCERGGVHRVLRLHFGPDDIGYVQKQKNGKGEDQQRNQRKYQNLSALPAP